MFRVFISAASLEKLCLEEMPKGARDQSDWFLLLAKQNTIYIDKDIYSDLDLDNPLFAFSESYEIRFEKSEVDFNSEVINNPASVLTEPQGAYLLDIDKGSADVLSRAFGLVCQSTEDLADCSLAEQECTFTLFKGEKNHSWEELFNSGTKLPSNSLIIIDRYIFGYEGTTRSGYQDGVDNIKMIMKNVLPDQLYCDYHVMILFSDSCSTDNNYSIDKVAEELDDFKNNELKKPYNIDIELFSVYHKDPVFADTHNRRILSNYFMVKAEHLFKVFRPDGTSITTQDLELIRMYSKGLRDKSDSAVRFITRVLSSVSQMKSTAANALKFGGPGANEYIYYNNTEVDKPQNIKNRLLQ